MASTILTYKSEEVSTDLLEEKVEAKTGLENALEKLNFAKLNMCSALKGITVPFTVATPNERSKDKAIKAMQIYNE